MFLLCTALNRLTFSEETLRHMILPQLFSSFFFFTYLLFCLISSCCVDSASHIVYLMAYSSCFLSQPSIHIHELCDINKVYYYYLLFLLMEKKTDRRGQTQRETVCKGEITLLVLWFLHGAPVMPERSSGHTGTHD